MSSGNKLDPHRFELAKDWKQLTQEQRNAVVERFRIPPLDNQMGYSQLHKIKPKLINSTTLMKLYPVTNPSFKVIFDKFIRDAKDYLYYITYGIKMGVPEHDWRMARIWYKNRKMQQKRSK